MSPIVEKKEYNPMSLEKLREMIEGYVVDAELHAGTMFEGWQTLRKLRARTVKERRELKKYRGDLARRNVSTRCVDEILRHQLHELFNLENRLIGIKGQYVNTMGILYEYKSTLMHLPEAPVKKEKGGEA